MSIAVLMLFAVVVSVAFCFLTFASMGPMVHTAEEDASSVPMHIDHMQTLNLATFSQVGSFSALMATLMTFMAFMFVWFIPRPSFTLQPIAFRKRRQSNDVLIDQFELHWLSLFGHSPDFLRPA